MYLSWYDDSYFNQWNILVSNSFNGTFLHTRNFMSYHGDRFHDMSLIISDDNGKLIGVFPAALLSSRENVVMSHPGITYGGIIHEGKLSGMKMVEAFEKICAVFKQQGIQFLQYKAIPYIYHSVPSEDDLYALFRLGADKYRVDLSATIDLGNRLKRKKGRKSDLKKAYSLGVKVDEGSQYFYSFWSVLENNLWSKYNKRPTHSVNEILKLKSRFPDNIKCVVGTLNDEVLGGVVLFIFNDVVHVQYMAVSPNSSQSTKGVLDLVIEYCIELSGLNGVHFFDFGISCEDQGKVLNEGLHNFKRSFGAGTVVYEFYELVL